MAALAEAGGEEVCPLPPPLLASGRCCWICPTNDAPKTSNGFDDAPARNVDVDDVDDDDDDDDDDCAEGEEEAKGSNGLLADMMMIPNPAPL